MNAFEMVNEFEMQGVEGGAGALVIGAFALVIIGITLAGGAIAYKGVSDLGAAMQPQQQGSCSGGSK